MMKRSALAALTLFTAATAIHAEGRREDPRMQRSARIEAYICLDDQRTQRCGWETVLGTTLIETYGDAEKPIIITKEMTLHLCNEVLMRQFALIQAKIAKDHAEPVTARTLRCVLADELKI